MLDTDRGPVELIWKLWEVGSGKWGREGGRENRYVNEPFDVMSRHFLILFDSRIFPMSKYPSQESSRIPKNPKESQRILGNPQVSSKILSI